MEKELGYKKAYKMTGTPGYAGGPDQKVENAVEMNPSEREIWAAAKGQGILTMKQDGVLKILKGITSLDELKRVITLED